MRSARRVQPLSVPGNLAAAQAFLDAITGGGPVTFQTFDDDKKRKDKNLARIRHGTLDQHADELLDLQARGAGVFFMVNEGDGAGRKGDNVIRVRALFVDLDGAPLQPVLEAMPKPHVVVESSPGRYHAYWRVADCALKDFSAAQRALIERFDGDKNVHDLPRVMRLPGFFHLKDHTQKWLVRMKPQMMNPELPAYQLARLLRKPDIGDGEAGRLRSKGMDAHKPPQPAGAPGKIPEGKRNDTLSRVAFKMRRAGVSIPAIEAALIAEDVQRCDPPLGEEECRRIARGKADIEEAESATWPAPLDLVRLARMAPAPPQFIAADWLPCGYATLFAGHGGVGESGIALHLAVCIALGVPFFGVPVQRRKVLYLSCEDRENILHWRLSRIARFMQIDLADLDGQLQVLDLVGRESVLWERDPRTGNALTAAYGLLGERVKELTPEVLMADGIADTFGGNENARTEVKAFVNSLLSLINPDSGAVLLIGHINRPSAVNVTTSQGYSGSTGWHNSVRARWYLYPEMEEDEESNGPKLPTGKLVLELQKSNLGRSDRAMSFAWSEDHGVFVAEEVPAMLPDEREHRERGETEWLLRAIVKAQDAGTPIPAATSGARTAHHVLSAVDGFPSGLKSKRRRFWKHLETLRQRGHIEEGTEKTGQRKDRSILLPTDVGREVASGEGI